MSVELSEDRIPMSGIEGAVDELVEVYGGEVKSSAAQAKRFVLPLRRGNPSAGGIECTLSWERDDGDEGTVRLTCDRDVDAPKVQRVMLLVAGVIGSLLFLLWPFYPHERGMGALAWLGGAIAIAVYLMSLRRTSGGIAADFLRRLADLQRAAAMEKASSRA
jgi:hypothetical protein